MGQLHSGPILSVATETFGNDTCRVGVAESNGWRLANEDRRSVKMRLRGHPKIVYVALFDGHGGNAAAQWFSEHLHEYVGRLLNPHDSALLEQAVMDADADFMRIDPSGSISGCTMVLTLIEKIPPEQRTSEGFSHRVTTAWTGDSRALTIDRVSGTVTATQDHNVKAWSFTPEFNRITAAGGFVDEQGYVSASPTSKIINLSRSLGDRALKVGSDEPRKFVVTALPEIHTGLYSDDTRIIMACDGLFDVGNNEWWASQLRIFARESLLNIPATHYHGFPAAEAARHLADTALQFGSMDNITVAVIDLNFECEENGSYGGRSTFVPAPVTDAQLADSVFRQAYEADCCRHGMTLEDALAFTRKGLVRHKNTGNWTPVRKHKFDQRVPLLSEKAEPTRMEGAKFIARRRLEGASVSNVHRYTASVYNECLRLDGTHQETPYFVSSKMLTVLRDYNDDKIHKDEAQALIQALVPYSEQDVVKWMFN